MRQLTRQRVVGHSFPPETEEQITGTSHGRLGAYLLGLWGLEHPLVEAVAFHHQPSVVKSSKFDLPSIVHVADALVHAIENERAGRNGDIQVDRVHLETLGVLDKLDGWHATAREMWEREPA
jgi:HD-like signal output (HDOD) protein